MTASKKKPRKRSTIKNAVAIDRIDKMIPLIIENVRIAIKLESALDTGNEVIREIRGDAEHGPHWYGANCYNTVINSVTLNLALTLAKLFDPGAKRMRPNKRDVASIPLLLRLIKQKRCRSALIKRAHDWTPQIADLASEHEATVLREIDAAVAVYTGLMSNHEGRTAAATLKGNCRDKKLCAQPDQRCLKGAPSVRAALPFAEHRDGDHSPHEACCSWGELGCHRRLPDRRTTAGEGVLGTCDESGD